VTNSNEAPTITSNGGGDDATINLLEGSTAVTTVTASDPDSGDYQTFSITGGLDQDFFTIDPVNGILSFDSPPDYETPLDNGEDNIYNLQVTVTDSLGLTDIQDITVSVTNSNEAPTITSNGGGEVATISMLEGSTAVTTVTATDSDGGDTQTYSISGVDSSFFEIDAVSGVLSFTSSPEYETPEDIDGDNNYNLQVTVTDSNGLTDTQDITVTVADVNTSIVVFDLVNGNSSDHSDRTFSAGVEYTIYIYLDSDAFVLNSGSTGGAADATWGQWLGGDKLGADDLIVFVGDTGGIDVYTGGIAAFKDSAIIANTSKLLLSSTTQFNNIFSSNFEKELLSFGKY
jgi:hypothetical protein